MLVFVKTSSVEIFSIFYVPIYFTFNSKIEKIFHRKFLSETKL